MILRNSPFYANRRLDCIQRAQVTHTDLQFLLENLNWLVGSLSPKVPTKTGQNDMTFQRVVKTQMVMFVRWLSC
ncbi:MAG: hypothetical protein C5B44_00725 [Acidobacteria bacterium]|nr:MAG: hypothetical protein C5B44_00725 [Acidobacteriota bacterium]